MKKLCTLLLALLPAAGALAQMAAPTAPPPAVPADSVPRYWDTHIKAGLNANEALLSSNWKGGGSSSLGLSALFNGQAHYQRGTHNWNGEADLLYAGQYTADGITGYRKTNDRLYLDSKYGLDLSKNWGFFTSLNLLTQFAPGFTYATDGRATFVSSFLAPGYVTSATGVEYHPNPRFSVRLAPIAPRITIVRQPDRFRIPADTTVYGVTKGHTTYRQFGAQALVQLDQPIGTNANLKARYLTYLDYARPDFRDLTQRLDLTLTAKFNKWLNASLGLIVLYDVLQDQRVQYSQNLALGILFDRKRPAYRPGQ